MAHVSDFTQSGDKIVLDLINEDNSTSLNLEEVSVALKSVQDPVSKNTVAVVSALPESGYTGSILVEYDRLNIQDFVDIYYPEGITLQQGDAVNIGDLITEIEAGLAIRLTEGIDFQDRPIGDWEGTPNEVKQFTLQMISTSMVYIGNMLINIDGNDIELLTILTSRILDGLNLPVTETQEPEPEPESLSLSSSDDYVESVAKDVTLSFEVTVQGGVSPYSYVWKDSAGTTYSANSNILVLTVDDSHIATEELTFTCEVTDARGSKIINSWPVVFEQPEPEFNPAPVPVPPMEGPLFEGMMTFQYVADETKAVELINLPGQSTAAYLNGEALPAKAAGNGNRIYTLPTGVSGTLTIDLADAATVLDMLVTMTSTAKFTLVGWGSKLKTRYSFKIPGLIDVPASLPTTVTSTVEMFSGATSFVGRGMETWYTGNLTTTSQMFWLCSNMEADLSRWDMSKVTDMSYMFYGASKFNSNISKWNTAQVTNMQETFVNCTVFNQDLSGWNVAKVTNRKSYNSSTPAWVLPKPPFV